MINGHHHAAYDVVPSLAAERRAHWPRTSNRHLLISRTTAHDTSPASTFHLKQQLFVRRRVRLDDLRVDGVVEEALHRGPDPLHLKAVFGANTFAALRYAEIAKLLQDPGPIR